jgi:Ras family protein
MIGSDSSLINSLSEITRPTKRRKILLLGAVNSGKSVLIARFKDNVFIEAYTPTIQENIKKFYEFRNEYVELEIIDIEGQTDFSIMINSKLSFGIHGYMLVYSINNKESFELVQKLNTKLNEVVGQKFPRVLIGTKSDLEREVSFSEGNAFANEINCPFIETSSFSNENVEKAFMALLIEINKNDINFDISKYCCGSILRCFVKNNFITKKLFFICLIMQILCGIASVYLSVEIITTAIDNHIYRAFFPLFYGIWIVVFALLCLFGLVNEKSEQLKIYMYSIVISICVLLSGIFIYKSQLEREEEEDNAEYKLYQDLFFFYLSLSFVCFNFVVFLITYVFKRVYELDLALYIL